MISGVWCSSDEFLHKFTFVLVLLCFKFNVCVFQKKGKKIAVFQNISYYFPAINLELMLWLFVMQSINGDNNQISTSISSTPLLRKIPLQISGFSVRHKRGKTKSLKKYIFFFIVSLKNFLISSIYQNSLNVKWLVHKVKLSQAQLY